MFRSFQHSSKVDARRSLAADKRVPRLILDDIEESSDPIMNLTSGISDIKQIYNYRYNYQTNSSLIVVSEAQILVYYR